MGISFLMGGDFFRWDLKTLCIKNREYKSIKNSEYKSQAKKMIPIVISTISYFWSPNNFLVVASLFSMVYGSPIHKHFLCGELIFVASGWKDFKFLGNLLYWGEPNSLFGRGGGGGLGHFPPQNHH